MVFFFNFWEMLQKQDRAESFYLQTLLTISCSNLRLAVNSPPSWFGASFPLPSVGQGSLTSPSSGPPEAVSGDPPASCVSPLMETSLQRQRPLRILGIPSSPLSLHPCPPPASPQPGQVHLGSRRPPLVRAERWESSARLAENPVGPFASFTAGPWAPAVGLAGSSRQPDRPANAAHTPRHQGLLGPGQLTRPCPPAPPCRTPSWTRPGGPPQRRAERAHPPRGAAGSSGGHMACGPLSVGSAAGPPTVHFVETVQTLEDGRRVRGQSAGSGSQARGSRDESRRHLRGSRQAAREQAGPPHPSVGAAAAALAPQRAAERDAVPEKLWPSRGPALPPSRLEPLQGPPPLPGGPTARGARGPYIPAPPGL